jgi:hypothetical protein
MMTNPDVDGRHRSPSLIGPVLPGCYLLVATVALLRLPYDVSGAFVIAPFLAGISAPLLISALRKEDDRFIRVLMPVGLVAACVTGIARLYVTTAAYNVYGGLPDPARYHSEGADYAAQFRNGDFTLETSNILSSEFVDLATGCIYTITGTTLVGGYLVYSWIAYWGIFLCYRAFRVAVVDHRRYAVLIFGLPSTLFWSCGIGKEAWMMLGIGLLLLGAARLLTGARRMWVPLLPGIAVAAVIRPHVSLLVIAALLFAYLIRSAPNSTLKTPLAKALTIGLIVFAGILATSQLATFVGVDEISTETVNEQMEKTYKNFSKEGDSAFTATLVKSPADLPGAATTVLFRPFPWEANGFLMLCASLESTFLAILIAVSWRRWSRIPTLLRKRPYVALSLVATLFLIVVLSAFGNFGTLVRERLMLTPFLLVPLCLSVWRHEQFADDGRQPTGQLSTAEGYTEVEPAAARQGSRR